MPQRDPLPPDPESLEKWQQMPNSEPSKQAMPPATGGMRGSVKLLIALTVLIILVALLQQGSPL